MSVIEFNKADKDNLYEQQHIQQMEKFYEEENIKEDARILVMAENITRDKKRYNKAMKYYDKMTDYHLRALDLHEQLKKQERV